MARPVSENTDHTQLILMMVQYFKSLGYTNIKADITGWSKPEGIYWMSNPNNVYYPDLTCNDTDGIPIILEAETCGSLYDSHTHEQFSIFRAHATNNHGRFEVVVPRLCAGRNARDLITQQAKNWGIHLDNVWTPSD